jgi:hypothetical protein
MKLVYIAHPVSGDVDGNIAKISRIIQKIHLEQDDIIPFAPYYSALMSLDDSDSNQRNVGIRANDYFFEHKKFDEMWVYGDTLSDGVKHEIMLAVKHGIPVLCMTDVSAEFFENYVKKLDSLDEEHSFSITQEEYHLIWMALGYIYDKKMDRIYLQGIKRNGETAEKIRMAERYEALREKLVKQQDKIQSSGRWKSK